MCLAHIVYLYVSLQTYKTVDSFPNSVNRLYFLMQKAVFFMICELNCGICGGQSGSSGIYVSPKAMVVPSQYHSNNAPCISPIYQQCNITDNVVK
jgi:hypothetical protein